MNVVSLRIYLCHATLLRKTTHVHYTDEDTELIELGLIQVVKISRRFFLASCLCGSLFTVACIQKPSMAQIFTIEFLKIQENKKVRMEPEATWFGQKGS